MTTYFVRGMSGLGDNIYQRCILPRDVPVYLQTPWPELYTDLPNIYPVKPDTKLRTQRKNVLATEQKWYKTPVGAVNKRIAYSGTNVINGMTSALGFRPGKFFQPSLPDFGERPIAGKYAIVRPATIRNEWYAAARNPRPEYIAQAAKALMDNGYTVVSIADLEAGAEYALMPLPPATIRYHAGELCITELLRYTQHADAIVGGIGWIVPAAIAQKRSALIICGGEGGWNSPNVITDPRMDLSKIRFALPDNFCLCRNHRHDCDKTISDFSNTLSNWLTDLVA